MKTKWLVSFFTALALFAVGCDKDDNNPVSGGDSAIFTSLESPYLICASRNPGGVGFDFEYDGKTGGANNMDSLTVNDFTYDIKIITTKAEKADGTLAGMPHIELSESAQAVNYSAVDTTCTGITAFENLTASNMKAVTFKSDDASFDLSGLETGTTGKTLVSNLQTEYKKLVIGDKWKTTANNDIADDEIVWVIKTSEGRQVKLIVTDFPADPAPTSTGYIAVDWDFIQ